MWPKCFKATRKDGFAVEAQDLREALDSGAGKFRSSFRIKSYQELICLHDWFCWLSTQNCSLEPRMRFRVRKGSWQGSLWSLFTWYSHLGLAKILFSSAALRFYMVAGRSCHSTFVSLAGLTAQTQRVLCHRRCHTCMAGPRSWPS